MGANKVFQGINTFLFLSNQSTNQDVTPLLQQSGNDEGRVEIKNPRTVKYEGLLI